MARACFCLEGREIPPLEEIRLIFLGQLKHVVQKSAIEQVGHNDMLVLSERGGVGM